MAGQTLNDRLTAARHTLAGQGLARIVCKATTEEVIGPKKKHLDYLLHCTNEPNVSIPQLANLLIERTQHASWVVVFKALVTVHHLMCYGNERFTQYLASSNCTFQLSNFLDKQGYDMSTFIRRYAKYLNEKAMSYRAVAFDFCKAKRGKEDGTLRTMPTDKLLKALPVLQTQLDALLEFDCTSNDLTNGVINSCFMLLFRDLIRLFACYNDGIINLLEKFFDMNKKNCREALDIYKKFLIRMDRVAELLKVAENVGIDKGDIPDLTKAPSSLLDALEQHLAALEGKKGGPQSTTNARQSNLKHAVNALLSTSHSFGSAASNGPSTTDFSSGTAKAQEVIRKAVEEEAAAMDQMREQRLKEKSSDDSPPQPSSKTNPFLSSPAAPDQGSSQGIIDLFSSSPPTSGIGGSGSQASSDLLCLAGNPFADSLFGSSAGGASVLPQTSQPPTSAPFAPPVPPQPGQIPFVSFNATPNGVATGIPPAPLSAAPPTSSAFGTEVNFAAAFGSEASGTSGFDNFGDILQPQTVGTTSATAGTSAIPPLVKAPLIAPSSALDGASQPKGSLIKGDLDSSLASLCQNLDINGPNQSLKKGSGHQWGSPKMSGKTGGSGWAPPAATPPNIAAWGMAAPPTAAPAGAPFPAAVAPQWGAPPMAGRPMMPAAGGPPLMAQPFAAPAMAGMRPPMGMGPQPAMAAPPGAMFPGAAPQQQPPPTSTSSSAVNDPFGAL